MSTIWSFHLYKLLETALFNLLLSIVSLFVKGPILQQGSDWISSCEYWKLDEAHKLVSYISSAFLVYSESLDFQSWEWPACLFISKCKNPGWLRIFWPNTRLLWISTEPGVFVSPLSHTLDLDLTCTRSVFGQARTCFAQFSHTLLSWSSEVSELVLPIYGRSLNSNGFSGPIPATIGNLSRLYWLDLADNQLTGSIPVSNGNNPGLDMLLHTKHLYVHVF